MKCELKYLYLYICIWTGWLLEQIPNTSKADEKKHFFYIYIALCFDNRIIAETILAKRL